MWGWWVGEARDRWVMGCLGNMKLLLCSIANSKGLKFLWWVQLILETVFVFSGIVGTSF